MFRKILVSFLAIFCISCKNNVAQKAISVGDKVPVFTLKDQNNQSVNIANFIGQPMVVYFYPKDDTSGCTKQACTFRDEFENFKNLNAKIIGISSDSVESHKKFEEKYQLPFTLLADINNKARKMFTGSNFSIIPKRITFVINKKGMVTHIFDSQFKIKDHIKNALLELEKAK